MPSVSLAGGQTTSTLRVTLWWRNPRLAHLTLVCIALAFTAAQFVLYPINAGPSWDEAIYISQVTLGEPAVFFDQHRSRGMVLVVAPAAIFDPPMWVIRTWVAIVFGAALYASFATWIRVAMMGAPAGAVVFLSSWSVLYFSSTLYPNFATALSVLGATGALISHLEHGRRSDLLFAAAWLGAAGLLRPADAFLVGVGLTFGLVFLWRRAAVQPLLVVGLGGAIGASAWLIEGYIRFGLGPVALATGAVQHSTGGPSPNQLPLYLANLEGPLRCRADCRAAFLADPGWQGIPVRSTLWLAVIGLLVVLAIVRGTRGIRRGTIVLGAILVFLLFFYARSGSAVNQRYMLPAFALISIAAGMGLWTLFRDSSQEGKGRSLATALLAIILVTAIPWELQQARMARAEMQESQQHRVRAQELARIITERADGEPCAVAASASYPQIQYWSSCLTVELRQSDDGRIQHPVGTSHSQHDLMALAEEGWRIFVVAQQPLSPGSPVHDWPSERIDSEILGRYELFELPPGATFVEPGRS